MAEYRDHESTGPVDQVSREAWSRAAARWRDHCAREVNWNKMVEIPALQAMIGEVAGKRTLEVGCGMAHHSILLARRGAEAFGCDPAPAMVDLARENVARAGVPVDLRLGGIEVLPEYPAASFDVVLFPLMLEGVDDLDQAFAGAARLLRPEGFVAVSVSHPIRFSADRLLADDGTTLRVVRHYLRRRVIECTGWIMYDEDGGEIRCKSQCRTIGDYVNALVRAGLLVEALEEPMAIPECRDLAPEMYESNLDCPQFLLIKAVKDPRR